MKYEPPYGITDPNAGYINGNPAAGIEGSIPPAASIEYPMREIVAAITVNGIVPNDGDLQQLARAIRSQASNYLIDNGAQNAMVVEPFPALGAYTPGLPLRVKVLFSNINDGTHETLTLDAGSGPANVIMPDGTLPPSNTLNAGGIASFAFDGVRWQVQSSGGVGGSGTNTQTITKIPYADDSGTASNAIVALYAPAVISITEGDFLSVKLAHPLVTGPANIVVNALPAKPVTRVDGSNPQTGDAAAGQVLLLCFDGAKFQIVSVTGSPPLADSPVRAILAAVNQYIPNAWVPTYVTGWVAQYNTFPAGNPLGPDFFVAPTAGVYLAILNMLGTIANGAYSYIELFDTNNNYITMAGALGVNAEGNVAQANSMAIASVLMQPGQKLRFAQAQNQPQGPALCPFVVWIGKLQ
jgi:hypothetical protein